MIRIEDVKEIALEAGKLIMHYYNSDFSSTIELKGDESPVTIADKEANKLILEKLGKLYPNIPSISEETEHANYQQRRKWDYFWMIDPLDGTKEFISKNGEFTVNIALIRKKTPVMGVVYAPATGHLYWAAKGQGAFSDFNGITKQIIARQADPQSKNLRIVVSRSHFDDETKEYLKKFIDPTLIQKGSSLKFMEIANGNADIYFRTNPINEWDTAASCAIIKEAGAEMLNIETGKKIHYNKKDLKCPGFIVLRKNKT
jgi:3'(2'), 5'-bisphosphate nucleotidase